MDVNQFLGELKVRGVYRAAAFYAAGAWVLLQIADIVFPAAGLPDWSITAVLLASAALFPVALTAAWFFDITAKGVIQAPDTIIVPQRPRLSLAQLVELSLIIALTSLVGYLYLDRLALEEDVAQYGRTETTASARPSIAVLPFVVMSGVHDIEYFGDGLAEEILNLLAKLNELDVAARTSSFYFKDKGQQVDIKEIADRLGVRHVLEGSIRFQGEKVRVTAQLIDAESGFRLWSDTYTRNFDDVFGLQDEIAAKVVENLQVLLSESSLAGLKRHGTVNSTAFDLYLRGRSFLRQPTDRNTLDSAVARFSEAVAIDSEYAAAYAGLCDALLVRYAFDLDSADFEAAERACHRALTRDSQAAAVYVALGNLYRYSGQYQQSEQEFQRAIAINPNAADAWVGLASNFVANNRPEQAEDAFNHAIAVQPNYWRGYVSMGNFLYGRGRVEESIPYYERMTEMRPDAGSPWNNLGSAYYLSGKLDSAQVAWRRALKISPSASTYANLGSSLFFLGRFDEAAKIYQQAAELTPEDYRVWGYLGEAYRFSPHTLEMVEPVYQRALTLVDKHLKLNPSNADAQVAKGSYLAALGRDKQARRSLVRAIELSPDDMYIHYFAATAYTMMNEYEQALQALEKALDLGYPWHLVQADAGLAPLKELPRYGALATREN